MKQNKNTNTPSNGGTFIEKIEMNNYVAPNMNHSKFFFGEYILNVDSEGKDFFNYIERMEIASTVNAAVISAYSDYIYGEGLMTSTGENLKKYISNQDVRLISHDYKLHGMAAIQVVYNKGLAERGERRVVKMYHVPMRTVGIANTANVWNQIEGYYLCEDWDKRFEFIPQYYPAFGTTDDAPSEVMVLKRPSNRKFFSLPDYISGIESVAFQQEFSHYMIQHIKNGFSAGHIISVVGIPKDATPEVQAATRKKIREQLTGAENAGKFFIAFDDSDATRTTISAIEVSDAHEQYAFGVTNSREEILMAHGVTDPSLFGIRDAAGFTSQAEMQAQALKTLYRSKIKPMREILLDGFEAILKQNPEFADVELMFKDFDELATPETNNDSITLRQTA